MCVPFQQHNNSNCLQNVLSACEVAKHHLGILKLPWKLISHTHSSLQFSLSWLLHVENCKLLSLQHGSNKTPPKVWTKNKVQPRCTLATWGQKKSTGQQVNKYQYLTQHQLREDCSERRQKYGKMAAFVLSEIC